MVTLLRLRRFCKFFFCHPCRQLDSHASSTFVQFRFCNLRKKKSFSFSYPLCGLLRSLRCDEIKFIKNIEPCHLVPFDCRSRWEVHDDPCAVCDIWDRSSPRKKNVFFQSCEGSSAGLAFHRTFHLRFHRRWPGVLFLLRKPIVLFWMTAHLQVRVRLRAPWEQRAKRTTNYLFNKSTCLDNMSLT